MSQPTQNSLIHVLFLWTTILSIVQGVFIVFFFTVGHHGQPQNSSVTVPGPDRQTQPQNSLGEMRIYKANEVNGKFNWVDRFPDSGTISIEGDDLKIQKDGYYFFNLQVTLKTKICPCNGTRGTCMVSILKDNEAILEGWINKNSCSTGLITTMDKLSAGTKLNITINLPHNQVEEKQSLTYLGIIMLGV